MSVLGKKWLIKNHDDNKSIFERIMDNRGFKSLEESKDFYNPFLFNDMEKAVQRIDEAIRSNEQIIIFGDYDVDGMSGAAIMVHILKKLKANVSCSLPNRVTDGYGLSMKFIEGFVDKKVSLVITVDCGISCRNEIKKAKENGIDTIITDHHTIPELWAEDAIAILHPKLPNSTYPFWELTGAGVAFKLAHALIQRYLPESEQKECLYSLLDMATLGTIADLGSLRDENRLIVSRGLINMTNTKWAGLKKLKELANIKEGVAMDTVNIGFQLAPRINAAGRIGDPYVALNLLLEEDPGEKVTSLGNKLEELNRQRQIMTEQAMKEAEAFVLNKSALPHILVAHSSEWHVGILGLVAGKLAERYGRPAIILQDFGDTLVASARSPEYFNMVEALTQHKNYLIGFGGHAQAAGFSIKKSELQNFTDAISSYAAEKLQNVELKSVIEIDCELSQQEVGFALLEELEKLSPFGVDNKKPTFVMNNLETYFIDKVGHDGSHLKFTVQMGEKKFPVIAFRMGQFVNELRQHNRIDLVFQLDRHRWNEREFIQLQALDFRIKNS